MKGVFGKFLDVNLSKGTTKAYDIPEEWRRKYLGGRGLGARILFEELDGGEEPLSKENILIFATGPLQGTGVATAGRHVVMAKSPKTRAVADSYVGGYVGHELGTCGYDGIIIRGKAETPTYLSLMEGEATLHDASELWGKGVAEVDQELKDRHEGVKVASIGIGGENLVKFACIMHDRNRAAGRPGLGAVMGSKKLKAIAVKGGLEKAISNKKMFMEIRKKFTQKLTNSPLPQWGKYGTTSGVAALNELGILPTKNFQKGTFEHAEKITGETMYDEILEERETCARCPVRCKRVVSTEFMGEKVKEKYGGPEYETLAAFGSLCQVKELDAIALANQKCNKYGLDTISSGNTIAFTMEATAKGLLEGGIEWGDAEGMIDLIEKIAHREGLGDRLAEGIDKIVEEMDADFAMEVKGTEIPMHDPRGKKALALSYATSPRGATHLEVVHDVFTKHPPELKELTLQEPVERLKMDTKPKYCKVYEDLVSFTNSAILCAHTSWGGYLKGGEGAYFYPEIRQLINAVTGLDINKKEMLTIGERNFNLLKLLTAREGYRREDDQLPKRFTQKLRKKSTAGQNVPLDELKTQIDKYYELRGWGETAPTKEKLQELGMQEDLNL